MAGYYKNVANMLGVELGEIFKINDTKNEQKNPCLKIKNKEEEYDDNYVYFDYNMICKLIHFYFSSKQYEKDKSNNNKAYLYNFNANIFNFFNDSINDGFTKESLQFIANLIYNFKPNRTLINTNWNFCKQPIFLIFQNIIIKIIEIHFLQKRFTEIIIGIFAFIISRISYR